MEISKILSDDLRFRFYVYNQIVQAISGENNSISL